MAKFMGSKSMYEHSPKMERGEDGKMGASKKPEEAQKITKAEKNAEHENGQVGEMPLHEVHAKHNLERHHLHSKHEHEHHIHEHNERGSKEKMHERHHHEHGEMLKRHDAELAEHEHAHEGAE